MIFPQHHFTTPEDIAYALTHLHNAAREAGRHNIQAALYEIITRILNVKEGE